MISSALQATKNVLHRAPPLLWCAKALGITRLGRRVYHRALLREGIYKTTILHQQLRMSVGSMQEIRRIEGLSGEGEFIRRMQDALRPGDVVFDIGANIGVISLLLAGHLPRAGVTVHAFEPEPRNVEALARNVGLNGFGDRVRVHPLALGASSAVLDLFVSGEVGEGRHSFVADPDRPCGTIPVPVRTAADCADELGASPSVMKIDVEGAEWDVLRGADRLFAGGVLRDVFIELHPVVLARRQIEVSDIHRWFVERGFVPTWSAGRWAEIHRHYRRSG